MSDPDDVLARAARELRETEEPGWGDLTDSLLAAVRATARRSAPVDARLPERDEEAGHRLQVADVALVRLVALALADLPGAAPARVRLDLDGAACRGARVHLVADYGTHLPSLADDARRLTAQVLDDVLGVVRPDDPPRAVDVVVDDVTPPGTA